LVAPSSQRWKRSVVTSPGKPWSRPCKKAGTFDLGGFKLAYSSSNNRGSDQVFLTVIQPDGSLKAIDRIEKSGT